MHAWLKLKKLNGKSGGLTALGGLEPYGRETKRTSSDELNPLVAQVALFPVLMWRTIRPSHEKRSRINSTR